MIPCKECLVVMYCKQNKNIIKCDKLYLWSLGGIVNTVVREFTELFGNRPINVALSDNVEMTDYLQARIKHRQEQLGEYRRKHTL